MNIYNHHFPETSSPATHWHQLSIMLPRTLRTPVRYHLYLPFLSPLTHPQALRATLSAISPSTPTHGTMLLPRISSSLLQTRLLSTEVRSAIDRAVASAPVVLFMKGTPETPQCGFSRTSIQILGMQGVDPKKFTAFNVLEDEELRSGIKEYSDWPTIPQLYVGKEFVGGCDILISMHKDGSLAAMLAEKGLIVEEDGEEVKGESS